MSVFWVAHFDFLSKKEKKNASSPWKLVINYRVARMGRNYDEIRVISRKKLGGIKLWETLYYLDQLENVMWM